MTDVVVPETDRHAGAAGADDAATLRRARVLNLFGLVTPVANLGMKLTARRELRWFGVGAGVLLLAVAWWAFARGSLWIAACAAGLHAAMVLAGLVNPRLPELLGRAWLKFGETLGRFMAFPIFALLYFAAVTPTALVLRLFGKDPLGRKPASAATYWVQRKPSPRERFERQF